jgi:hypothetical protein
MNNQNMCLVCGVGVMINEGGKIHCDVCQSPYMMFLPDINWKVLAGKIISESKGKPNLELFVPPLIAVQLQMDKRNMTEFKSYLPENIAKRLRLNQKAGKSYALSFYL